MFKIAIIDTNKFYFNQNEYKKEFNHANLKEDIKDLITFKNVKLPELMDDIVEAIGLDKILVGNTNIVTENDKYVYQICHLSMKDNGKEDDEENINGLASCLTLGYTNVYGPAVLLCSRVSDTNMCVPDTIDLDRVTEILYEKIHHTALLVKAVNQSSVIVNDKIVEEVYFHYDPKEIIDIDNFKYVECPFLKFNLLVLFNNDNTKPINKLVTKLVGKQRIYGDCYVLSKSAENEYIDFNLEIFKKILNLAEGSLKDRELEEDEKDKDEEDNKLPIIMNRYCILNKRHSKYSPMCNYCKTSDDAKVICTGCYRVRYHNKECQLKDWPVHHEDCVITVSKK